MHQHKSPWEIGAAHWNQRDLYTTNDRIDDAGYARGPSTHPETGSYAYQRDFPPPSHRAHVANIHEREAWPWLNYKRVDSHILDDARAALTDDATIDATDITVEVKDGEVTLAGTVADLVSKERAEANVANVRGVHLIHNRLTLRKTDDDDLVFTSPILVF